MLILPKRRYAHETRYVSMFSFTARSLSNFTFLWINDPVIMLDFMIMRNNYSEKISNVGSFICTILISISCRINYPLTTCQSMSLKNIFALWGMNCQTDITAQIISICFFSSYQEDTRRNQQSLQVTRICLNGVNCLRIQ